MVSTRMEGLIKDTLVWSLCCGESGDAARYQQTGANRRPPHISGYHWNLNGRVDLLGWTAAGEMDTQSIQWCSDGRK